jgi:short-subunit dehydrogenase
MAHIHKTAIIIGASSGIGEALARQLHQQGWSLGLLARRTGRLAAIAEDLKERVSVSYTDVSSGDCGDQFAAMLERLGEVDLVIISAGAGHLNAQRDIRLDQETAAVNISGFMAIAEAAFRYFQHRGQGHLAAITSVAALRASGEATAYAASKAFQSVYLDGLRDSARRKKLAITVTELQPGFVDTDMMKTGTPFSPLIRRLLVSDPATAAGQMLRTITRRRSHAYITRRYAVIALLMKLLPRPGS